MIAGSKERDQCAGDGAHPTREQYRAFRALERGHPLLDDLRVRRISVAWVAESVARSDFLNEIDRLEDRPHDRVVRVAPWCAAVDRDRCGRERFWFVRVGHGSENYAYDVGGRRPRESRSGLTTRTISDGAIPVMSRTVTSPGRIPGSMCTVASSWRRGP